MSSSLLLSLFPAEPLPLLTLEADKVKGANAEVKMSELGDKAQALRFSKRQVLLHRSVHDLQAPTRFKDSHEFLQTGPNGADEDTELSRCRLDTRQR